MNMAKTERKRFQSGKEIMETYVPGYEPTGLRRGEVEAGPTEASGTEMAEALLQDFNSRLSSIRLRPTRKGK